MSSEFMQGEEKNLSHVLLQSFKPKADYRDRWLKDGLTIHACTKHEKQFLAALNILFF